MGEQTGQQVKCGCGQGHRFIAEHACYHPTRRRATRRDGIADGRCTPAGKCTDADLGIQPCAECPLHAAQRLLPPGGPASLT